MSELWNSIFVGKIPSNTTEQELRELFELYGRVSRVDLRDTHAFIHFSNQTDTQNAIRSLNGSSLRGNRIVVSLRRIQQNSQLRESLAKNDLHVIYNSDKKRKQESESTENEVSESKPDEPTLSTQNNKSFKSSHPEGSQSVIQFGETVETDRHRIAMRMKQILFGKNTIGYDNYIAAVPKHLRCSFKEHPRTPDPLEKVSKRAFDGKVSAWRRSLHQWSGGKEVRKESTGGGGEVEIDFDLAISSSFSNLPSTSISSSSISSSTTTTPPSTYSFSSSSVQSQFPVGENQGGGTKIEIKKEIKLEPKEDQESEEEDDDDDVL